MNILVLLGGESPEHDVSIRSGKAVIKALEAGSKFTVRSLDPSKLADKLEEAVTWADVVLPILHGINGEDGVIQERLETLDADYFGTDAVNSAIAFSKQQTHKKLEAAGIKMPKADLVTAKDVGHALFQEPFVLKPVKGGSSIDTLIVHEVNETDMDAARTLLDKYGSMILEELVLGQEITVPVLGNATLPVIAIIPPKGADFDYENKYNGATQEICPVPENLVSAELQQKAQALALQVHQILRARDISRTDMIIEPNGDITVLELNTMPGLTEQSLFPKAAAAVGISMAELVDKFVILAKEH